MHKCPFPDVSAVPAPNQFLIRMNSPFEQPTKVQFVARGRGQYDFGCTIMPGCQPLFLSGRTFRQEQLLLRSDLELLFQILELLPGLPVFHEFGNHVRQLMRRFRVFFQILGV